MAEVKIESVRKSYDNGVPVIHGIDMHIADGEFIVIVGPSGCGKSTLLRMIAGLESITGGSVCINGREVNQLEPKDRDVAMVFQNYALYPHMTVFQNMGYALKIARRSREEIEEKVQKAAAILELDALLHRKPRELSGGQRQRVAMGRAIVREPSLFLFDEPLSNLDAKLRVQMRLEIKKLQRTLGTTSIYVTHDQVEAMTLADRLIVMNAGRAEQIGRPMDVYEKPATSYVGGFIGSPAMNLLAGAICDKGVGIVLAGDSGASIPLPRPLPGQAGKQILLGLRPEDMKLAATNGMLALDVELNEPLGADTLVHGRIMGGQQVATVRLPGYARVRPGERCALNVQAEKFHVFDATSGKRIEVMA